MGGGQGERGRQEEEGETRTGEGRREERDEVWRGGEEAAKEKHREGVRVSGHGRGYLGQLPTCPWDARRQNVVGCNPRHPLLLDTAPVCRFL